MPMSKRPPRLVGLTRVRGQQLDCDGAQVVEFFIDAQIGSEVGGQPFTVRGTFRAPIGSIPPVATTPLEPE